jgi:REP element-mobilizing transposase RayT
MKTNKRFHITWFTDEKKTILAGTTIEADNIIDAVEKICSDSKYTHTELPLDISKIKYAMEL